MKDIFFPILNPNKIGSNSDVREFVPSDDMSHVIHVISADAGQLDFSAVWPSEDPLSLELHDGKKPPANQDAQSPIGSDVSSASRSTTDSDDEAAAHSKQFCWGICCVQGCIWGILGMIYFFVFLPSGFLLILFGHNKHLAWAMATGVILLVMSTFGFPAMCIGIRYYTKKRRDRRREYRVDRNKQLQEQTYDNPAEAIAEEVA